MTAALTPAPTLGNAVRRSTVGVTGATGFVGRAVCRELAQRGWTVVPLTRAPAGLAGERVLGDLADLSPDTDAVRGLDAIVHAAARVHVMNEGAADPLEEYRRVNTVATIQLARAASVAGVQRFVFISSIKVNGEATTPGRPYRASDAPAPLDPYGISKLEAERELADLATSTGVDVVVIRPVLIYGPGAKANFAALMSLVGRGVPLPFRRIANRRSFIYVGNLTDLIALCLVHPAAPGRTFLAADADPVSTPALVAAMARALDRRARLVPFPVALMAGVARLFHRQAAVQRLTGDLEVDIGETRRVLAWAPPFTLADGLSATVVRVGGTGA